MKLNNYEIMIAWRFLVKGRLQTLFIILGIAMGVAVQFFLSSLIGGLQNSIIERTVGSAPHLVISPEDRIPAPIDTGSAAVKEFRKAAIEERPEIFSWQQYVLELKKDKRFTYISPVANGNGFMLEGSTVHPVRVKGLLEPDGPGIYRIRQKLIAGKERFSGETALVAKELADKLALTIGDKFIMRNDEGENVSLIAGGIFDLGTATGSSLVVLSLDRVRAFFGIDGVSAIEAQVKDVFDAEAIAQKYSRYFELDPILGIIYVSEKDYVFLKPGQSAFLTTDAHPDEIFAGQISRIAPIFRQATRQARIEITIENHELRLKPGMFIRATIVFENVKDALIVPEQALTKRDNKDGIFIVNDDKKTVRWCPVKVGIRDGEKVQIDCEGLTNGLVVTLGQQLVDDGSEIHISGESNKTGIKDKMERQK